jgi:hypothetical protein
VWDPYRTNYGLPPWKLEDMLCFIIRKCKEKQHVLGKLIFLGNIYFTKENVRKPKENQRKAKENRGNP